MNKKAVLSKGAPAPIGPYSQGIISHGFLFLSGQIAIVPETGELLLSSIEEETKQVMKNIEALLQEANLGFDNVVKTSIFLSSMDHYGKVNEVYGKYFKEIPPAREAVAVLTLPKNVNVEISVIAATS